MEQLENVYIEHCTNCFKHNWCTKHDEQKYLSYLAQCTESIQSQCQQVQVVPNEIPLGLEDMFYYEGEQRSVNDTRIRFPQLGAFEIYCRGQLIFSKLQQGIWPHPAMIASQIKQIIEENTFPRLEPKQNSLRKRQMPVKRQQSEQQLPSVQKKVEEKKPQEIKKQEVKKQEKKPSNKPQQIEESQTKFEQFEGDDADKYQNLHSSMEIDGEGSIFDDEFNPTISYTLQFPINQIKYKKIPYTNKEDRAVNLKLSSSNQELMQLKHNEIQAEPQQEVKFQLKFKPVTEIKTETLYLLVKEGEEIKECIEIKAEYGNS